VLDTLICDKCYTLVYGVDEFEILTRLQHHSGMREKRKEQTGQLLLGSSFYYLFQYFLMPLVYTVKSPYGDNGSVMGFVLFYVFIGVQFRPSLCHCKL
jgi:hypothetical protein